MHRKIVLLASIVAWFIVGTADFVTFVEQGPALPTHIHNLILSALITVTVIGAILWVQPQGGYTDGYADGFVDGTSGRRPHLHSVDRPSGS